MRPILLKKQIKQIKTLLRNGKIIEAIDLAARLNKKNKKITNHLVLLRSQIIELTHNRLLGLVEEEKASIETNRILLSVLSVLENDSKVEGAAVEIPLVSSNIRLLAGLCAGLSLLLCWSHSSKGVSKYEVNNQIMVRDIKAQALNEQLNNAKSHLKGDTIRQDKINRLQTNFIRSFKDYKNYLEHGNLVVAELCLEEIHLMQYDYDEICNSNDPCLSELSEKSDTNTCQVYPATQLGPTELEVSVLESNENKEKLFTHTEQSNLQTGRHPTRMKGFFRKPKPAPQLSKGHRGGCCQCNKPFIMFARPFIDVEF